jgi:hypothetical protein
MLHGRVGQAFDTRDSSLVIVSFVDCSKTTPFARIKMQLRLIAVLSLDMAIQPRVQKFVQPCPIGGRYLLVAK